MVRLLLTGAVGLCLLPTAFSQGTSANERGVLKGNVVDTANGPISKAFVLVHRSGADDLNAHPDERGDFELRLAPGLYDIFVSADGFAPGCKRIEIKTSQVTKYRVKLQPDSKHMQADPVQTEPIH